MRFWRNGAMKLLDAAELFSNARFRQWLPAETEVAPILAHFAHAAILANRVRAEETGLLFRQKTEFAEAALWQTGLVIF